MKLLYLQCGHCRLQVNVWVPNEETRMMNLAHLEAWDVNAQTMTTTHSVIPVATP